MGGANVVFGNDHFDIVLRFRRKLKQKQPNSKEIFAYMNTEMTQLERWMPKMELLPIRQLQLQMKLDSPEKVFSYFQSLLSDGIVLDSSEEYVVQMERLIYGLPTKINKYLTIFNDREILTVEMKPKWLNWSGDDICRNCKVAEMKKESIICPLHLVSGKEGIERWCSNVHKVLLMQKVSWDIQVFDQKLYKTITENFELLQMLKKLQQNDNLAFAMTVRDVSIVYNLETCTAKVIDLDLKASNKISSWKQMETKVASFSGNGFDCAFKAP